MKTIQNSLRISCFAFMILIAVASCKKEDFSEMRSNPNYPSKDQIIPPSQLLSTCLYEIAKGGGVLEADPGYVNEEPFREVGKWSQYIVSNDSYYGGNNTYNWSNSATMYSVLRNVIEMEKWANPENDPEFKVNPYAAMGKFLRAYSSIWFSQRVGDIPMSEAGQGLENRQPKYDTQQEVYLQSLELLDEANTMFNEMLASPSTPTTMGGDFYLDGSLEKWQRVVNAYTLRVLISLSNRADDTPELNIKGRFATILNDPATYPIMTGNGDNVQFEYNSSTNRFPKASLSGNYNASHNISKTYLDLMTANQDPRTFVTTCPAPAEIEAGKDPDDFSAYVGSDNSVILPDLNIRSANGEFSHSNHRRYYNQEVVYDNAEPTILIGYAEMCFNIAEGINRGWATGDAGDWYEKGIEASLAFYGIEDGASHDIEDLDGQYLGTTTFDLAPFLASVNYLGDNADGLQQILEQKYINFHQNSGWEPFYQWRRTGIPAFIDSGDGINASGRIPRRWQYPPAEKSENTANVNAAIDRQFGGVDDLYQDLWIVK